jgi:addiction module HigA family antidote
MKRTRPVPNYFAETLRESLEDCGKTQKEVAEATGIPGPHLSELKTGKRRCTVEHDLRLSRFFSMTPGLWTRLQLDYEFETAKQELGTSIEKQVKPLAAA